MADPRRIRRGVFVLFGAGSRSRRGQDGVGSGWIRGALEGDSRGIRGGFGVDFWGVGGVEAAVGVRELGVRWGCGVPRGVVCG